MTDRVFLTFNNERDTARAQQVSLAHGQDENGGCSGALSREEWLALERRGATAVQRWIDSEIASSSATVVLIGGETCSAPWVHYAIRRSRAEGRGMFGLYVHRLTDPRTGRCDYRGQSPFELTYLTGSNPPMFFSEIYPVYDWVADDGALNLSKWIALARAQATRHATGPRRREAASLYRPAVAGSSGMNSPSSTESPRTR